MKKQKLISVIGCALFFAFPGMAAADSNDVVLKINEAYIEATPEQGQAYINDGGRTMIPLRLVSESLGYTTQWQEDGRISITSHDASVDVTLQVGSVDYLANGTSGQFETAPVLKNNRTYLPARDFSELYGSIYWDGVTRTVWIYQDDGSAYSILGNELLRANAEDIVPVKMPQNYDVSSLGKPDQVLAQRMIDGKGYVAIGYNMNHSLNCPLFRDDGSDMTYLTTINGSSSFWVEGHTIYHTDGTNAGLWSSGIDPNRLYVTKLSEAEEETKTYELDFPVNACTLDKVDGQLIATDENGMQHRIELE